MNKHIQKIPEGPLDLIGDVHGEIHALYALLTQLGYDNEGHHPDQRKLVFVGDLCDRGIDSPAVIEWVQARVQEGRAFTIIGNHELNILRDARREGNGWCFEDDHDQSEGKFTECAAATDEQRQRLRAFFNQVPVALYRDDIRVVHACWHQPSMNLLDESALSLDQQYLKYRDAVESDEGLKHRADEQEAEYKASIKDPTSPVPFLDYMAQRDVLEQMGNPLRVVTSGVERVSPDVFYSSGKWRFTERVAWWNEYEDDIPVIIGHYWRWPPSADWSAIRKGGIDLFDGLGPFDWMGPKRNVFCVDYCVGMRFHERVGVEQESEFTTHLAAMRWPERQLVFSNGGEITLARM